jgi:TetR/AcrR family tetracycline transcriptional repressor
MLELQGMSPEEKDAPTGLSRARLVSAALELVDDEGLEGLSMRGLADRLHVKAASLYWHVRDRRELLELLAASILDGVRAAPAGTWRPAVLGTAWALGAALSSQRDADRILLEVPDALRRSQTYAHIKSCLEDAGLQPSESADVALMVMTHAISTRAAGEPPMPESEGAASIAVDSGSRGVVLRHGVGMETLIRVPHDPAAAAPAVVHGETVKVRRLRGVGRGDIELNPHRAWRFQIQGPTWNTVLDVGGLDVREIKLDSGAAKVECFLPRPRGVVPIIVSGGVIGVNLHMPPNVAVVADVSSGAVRVKLDTFSVKAAITDIHWESAGASASPDRYEVRIAGGAVQVSLDDSARPQPTPPRDAKPAADGESASALDILLDGVESRVSSRR